MRIAPRYLYGQAVGRKINYSSQAVHETFDQGLMKRHAAHQVNQVSHVVLYIPAVDPAIVLAVIEACTLTSGNR